MSLTEAGSLTEPGRRTPWITNPYVRWRHPAARVAVAAFVLLLDLFSFCTDPVNDSHVEYNLPGLGNLFSFLAQWPADAGLMISRLGLICLCCVAGIYAGRQWLHHLLLRDCCGLSMFVGTRGSFLPIGLMTFSSLMVGSIVYNWIIPSAAQPITGATGVEACTFGKGLQCVSTIARSIALLQILDGVLQDRHWYPDWADAVKTTWNEAHDGWFRVYTMWALGIIAIGFAVLATQATDAIGLNEIARAFVGTLVMYFDLLIVVQDWEFPTFELPGDLEAPIMIAGTFRPKLSCQVLSALVLSLRSFVIRVLGREETSWDHIAYFLSFKITGPWISYGPILCAIFLDLLCTRTQILYEPQDYGQYVDPATNRIWTIIDDKYLQEAYKAGVLEHPERITWSARRNATTGAPLDTSAASDLELNSAYLGGPVAKCVAALPGLLILTFFVLICYGERAGRPPAPVKRIRLPKPKKPKPIETEPDCSPPEVTNQAPAAAPTMRIPAPVPTTQSMPALQLNCAGFPMTLGDNSIPGWDGSRTYYCGRVLGLDRIPGSDGQCGPIAGPQCDDCRRMQEFMVDAASGSGAPRVAEPSSLPAPSALPLLAAHHSTQPLSEGTLPLASRAQHRNVATSPHHGQGMQPMANDLLPLRLAASTAADQQAPDAKPEAEVEGEQDSPTPRKARSHHHVQHFDVLLKKRGQPLGLHVEKPRRVSVKELLVVEVLPRSAVGDHNLEQVAAGKWDSVVLPGMLIAAVNGIRGDASAMSDALLTEEILTVRFLPAGIIPPPPLKLPANGAAAHQLIELLSELTQKRTLDLKSSLESEDAGALIDSSGGKHEVLASLPNQEDGMSLDALGLPRPPGVPSPPRRIRQAAHPELPPGPPPALPHHSPYPAPLEALLGRLVQGADEDAMSSGSDESV